LHWSHLRGAKKEAVEMEYIDAILGHVVPIISEASKSQFGFISLIALIVLAIVLLFLYLTARTRPVLSFALALVVTLLMFGGVIGLVLSVDVRKPPIVYDVDMLQRLQTVGFKIPHLEDKETTDYELLDGMLQRQPNGTWHERQQQPRGTEVVYEYKLTNAIPGKIDYRRLDDTVDLFIDFPQRKICWRETAPPSGAGEYHCPYAVVSFD
jgi:hypothetical protein